MYAHMGGRYLHGMPSEVLRCQLAAVEVKNSEGKTCTRCNEWKGYGDFHKNKEKSDGRGSHCNVCVSERKTRRRDNERALKAKFKKNCAGFNSTVRGELATTQLNVFADVLGAAIKEVLDGT